MSDRQDVLIIGGGVIGLSAAYYLSKRGASVTVLERSEVGAGSSKGNAGWIVPSYSIPISSPHSISSGLKWMLDSTSPFYIKPRLDVDLASWLLKFVSSSKREKVLRAIPLLRDLNRTSLRLLETMIAEEAIDCHYHRNGVLTLFITDHEMRDGEEEVELLQRFGIQIEMIGREEVERKAPIASESVRGGMFSSEDAHMDPYAFLKGLADAVVRSGVEIRTGTPSIGFDTGNGRILSVNTPERRYRPDFVVLAAGAWTAPIARQLQISLPIQPAKGYSLTMERSGEIPEVPMMLGESKVAVTPLEGRVRFAGTLELSGFGLEINRRRVEAILDGVRKYLRIEPSGAGDAEVWAGLRPCTPDGVPLIGMSRRWSNLVIASGHCMLGVSMGPVTGEIVARLISGEPTEFDMAMLAPERFST
jgi:D-amino-acid dehydrogenase